MNLLKALEAIEAAPRGNARLEALEANDSPELREYLNLALSPQITFGMKQLPDPIPAQVAILRNEKHYFTELKDILDKLAKRELTGNAADQYVGSFFGLCDDVQLKWAERVIRQDLRLNIGAKDVNKVLGDVVFQFNTPLAKSYDDVKDYKGRWIIQPKLDGARCVAYLGANGGRVTLYSRTGKEWKNFESVRVKLEEVNNLRRFHRNKDVVLDGEVVSFIDDKINFQAIQANLFQTNGTETGKLKYYVFDMALRTDWESQADIPYKTRFDNAKQFVTDAIQECSGSVFKLGIVDGFSVENPTRENLEEYCTNFTDKGFEGAMARKEDSPIKLKRVKELLKIKTFLDGEAEIVGFAQGQGKNINMMGALVCKTNEGVVFEIGTGFSDEQRKKFYRDESLIGQYASYKYKFLTNDRVPFHNSFRGIRSKDDFLEGSK